MVWCSDPAQLEQLPAGPGSVQSTVRVVFFLRLFFSTVGSVYQHYLSLQGVWI